MNQIFWLAVNVDLRIPSCHHTFFFVTALLHGSISLWCTQYTQRGHGPSLWKDSESISLLSPWHKRAALVTLCVPSREQGQKSPWGGSRVCVSIHHHTSDSKAARCYSLTGKSFCLGTFLVLQHSCQNLAFPEHGSPQQDGWSKDSTTWEKFSQAESGVPWGTWFWEMEQNRQTCRFFLEISFQCF